MSTYINTMYVVGNKQKFSGGVLCEVKAVKLLLSFHVRPLTLGRGWTLLSVG